MWKRIAPIAIALFSFCLPCLAQSRYETTSVSPPAAKAARIVNPFAGKWTYRSYRNLPKVIVGQDPALALSLLFGEGVMTIDDTDTKVLEGMFDMGGGYVLDLKGTVRWQTYVSPTIFEISGVGRPGTPTEGWQYDYVGTFAWEWPNGIDQVPAIVGTVVRAKPHGAAKAGYVASFIATRQP